MLSSKVISANIMINNISTSKMSITLELTDPFQRRFQIYSNDYHYLNIVHFFIISVLFHIKKFYTYDYFKLLFLAFES